MRIAVILEGGLVQSVVTDRPNLLPPDLEVLVIDYDTDGADPDDLSHVPQSDGSLSAAIIHHPTLERATIALDAIRSLDPMACGSEVCGDCGASVRSLMSCPDGAEVCHACFEAGGH